MEQMMTMEQKKLSDERFTKETIFSDLFVMITERKELHGNKACAWGDRSSDKLKTLTIGERRLDRVPWFAVQCLP